MLWWFVFIIFVILMLVLDLAVFHRHTHVIKVKEALLGSAFWVGLALAFCAGVYFYKGPESALHFLTGYLIEQSLSVDNLFVFLVVFGYFKVPHEQRHRLLFWGILGALVMRAIFILGGVALMNRFHAIIYIFGAFLIFTGIKLIFDKEKEIEPEKNIVLKGFKKIMPVTHSYEGKHFFIKRDKKLYATPLFVVLLIIETTDLIFAIDSIPAVLAITTDSFIVFTSNIFAILGLRSLFFALAGLMEMFKYLHYGLGAVLVFVGVKMAISDWYHVPVLVALSVIIGILGLTIFISLREIPPQEFKDKVKV